MSELFNFEVRNSDVVLRFSCSNHGERIGEIVRNLCIVADDASSAARKLCRFTAVDCDATFCFNGVAECGGDVRHEVVFFDNTDYPVLARGEEGVEVLSLSFNGHDRSGEGGALISNGGVLYGSWNFRNQVGQTEIALRYRAGGTERVLTFVTEVLSRKLDYRSDLRTIIADIEHEYAMLSMSFLKDTYLSIRQHMGESHELVWWQIFRSCYTDIVSAAQHIIDRPKRRLRAVVRYERAERLPMLPRELENEYELHRGDAGYLYRTEELVLSHDTVENRFLKYALREMSRRFVMVKRHIMAALHLENPGAIGIDTELVAMEEELLRLSNHSFFRGVGAFRGFSQDSLVMKQAVGYKTIMEKWVELQQGYEIEEGLRRLEVKDVSALYEIWCFIKVKNIVADTLRELGEEAGARANGRMLSSDYIPQLLHGGSVSFVDSDDVELAAVSYNSDVKTSGVSYISGTSSVTTEQRPDIVLRLSKRRSGGLKYTYLFDAKYRIDDNLVDGCQVPPEDAVNQMHRYRDAIYYSGEGMERSHLKKEIIAGYVLFPGTVSTEKLLSGDYHYQRSNTLVGIGAFPLRPDGERRAADGSVVVDPESSEQALRQQIRAWLTAEDPRESLLQQAIPQKGLTYAREPEDIILLGYSKDERGLCKEKMLYYIRTEVRKEGVPLTERMTRAKYLLLYDDKERELYELEPGSPKVYSREELKSMGFKPQTNEFYIAYRLKSSESIANLQSEAMKAAVSNQLSLNRYDKMPVFLTFKELLSGVGG